MKTYRNIHFAKRDYECTNVVACRAAAAPNADWAECDPSSLPRFLTDEDHQNCIPGMIRLQVVAGVEYWGYL